MGVKCFAQSSCEPMAPKTPRDTHGEALSEMVALKMTPSMKQRLMQAATKRRQAEAGLSLQFGLSEYIRDVLAQHLATLDKE